MKLNVDYLDDTQKSAIQSAMGKLLERPDLSQVWPGASDYHRRHEQKLDQKKVEIVIVPLDRIGAPAGASGAKVFVAYFGAMQQDNFNLASSPPLIIKLQRGGKLRNELDAASHWPSLDPKTEMRFARPIGLYTEGGWDVLIAPFRAAFKRVPGSDRIHFPDMVDLWRKTAKGPTESVANGVRDAIQLVTAAHQAGQGSGQLMSMTYGAEYKWYLRDTISTGGNSTQQYNRVSQLLSEADTVDGFGLHWPNPSTIVRALITQDFTGVRGPVHGDLHPKNIVFDEDDRAHIIDFGWAKGEGHVIIDYVLLDINLRSMTLSPHLQEKEILDAARYLSPDDDDPALTGELHDRMSIVKGKIWSVAKANGLSRKNGWYEEYLVPFFLVAYGLLVHLESARNQRALLATVLASAQRIQQEGLL